MIDIRKAESMTFISTEGGERESLARHIEECFNGFRVIETIDTEGAAPLVSVLDEKNVMRDDIAKKHFSRGEILAGAPEQYGGAFRIPGIL